MNQELKSQLQSLTIPNERRQATRSGRPRRNRLVGVVMLLLLVVVGGGAWWQSQQDHSANSRTYELYTVQAVGADELPAVLVATGEIVSDHQVEVATKVSGQIVDLKFEQGDTVQQGQVLARIENVLYKARRDEAAAQLVKSKANLAYQQFNFNRVSQLMHDTVAAELELAVARRDLDEAQAQELADQAALDFMQKMLTDCEVIAPIAGVILERNVEVGDFVAAEGGIGANANAQFGTIADMTKLRVEVDISELDINRLRAGLPCRVVPDAYKDRRYRGTVLWIDPAANYAKATVQVKVRIHEPDVYLRVEGAARVSFLPDLAEAEMARSIWIPVKALLAAPSADTDHRQIWVMQAGRGEKREIEVGPVAGGWILVRAGLADNEVIVASQPDDFNPHENNSTIPTAQRINAN
ncbi:MAG: Multidrug resistance protein MdtA [Phycisphaerae bacterium]|nr:Multidrug resistance protein MdtA [Phycisphaerae bacterium]